MKPLDPHHALDPFDALLRVPLADLPDGGFSEAVMRRVRTLPPALTAAQALGRLERQRAHARRAGRYSILGLALGALFALAWLAAAGGVPADMAARGGAVALALAVSGAALGWALLGDA